MRYLAVLLLLAACAAAPDTSDVEAAGEAEAKAYAKVLTEKVQRGELSETEARYLYQQKVNDLVNRLERAQRERYSYRPIRPTETDCHPDGYGGVRCKTR